MTTGPQPKNATLEAEEATEIRRKKSKCTSFALAPLLALRFSSFEVWHRHSLDNRLISHFDIFGGFDAFASKIRSFFGRSHWLAYTFNTGTPRGRRSPCAVNRAVW